MFFYNLFGQKHEVFIKWLFKVMIWRRLLDSFLELLLSWSKNWTFVEFQVLTTKTCDSTSGEFWTCCSSVRAISTSSGAQPQLQILSGFLTYLCEETHARTCVTAPVLVVRLAPPRLIANLSRSQVLGDDGAVRVNCFPLKTRHNSLVCSGADAKERITIVALCHWRSHDA